MRKNIDPACGSGNFLTETFICLRRLENRVIDELTGKQQVLDFIDPIKVSIKQFYGIEVNDFAVTVAKTALWIAESQMMQETEGIIHKDLDFLPLKTNAYIHEGNALRMDWNDVIPASKCSYIMGNPPFRGYSLQSREQKADILSVYVDEKGQPYKAAGKIDYVAGWYFKTAQYMQGTSILSAFVSTNSITQGEQVAGVWKPLFDRFHVHIDFAYRTFIWNNEASEKAAVHCVIVGFSEAINKSKKVIYEADHKQIVRNINPYLNDAPTVFVEPRTKPISNVPPMMIGGKPVEGGNLILSKDEKDEYLYREPQGAKYIHPFLSAKDFIDRKERYCFWLVNVDPGQLKKCPLLLKRIEKVRQYRLSSKKIATKRSADTPFLFQEIKQPKSPNYILVPRVSSERRKYVPIDFVSSSVIASDAVQIIPDATLFHFGVLTSNVHMSWMRTVAGRLKSDYRYSNTLVYNTFPWPTETETQKARIEKTAQEILDIRAKYPDSSFADLYDPLLMPPDLRKAHQENDKAVMEAYGFNWHTMTEPECVAELMKMYQKLVEKEKESK